MGEKIVNLIWSDLKISVDQDEASLPHLLAIRMKVPLESITNWRIIRRFLDARKNRTFFLSIL
jgi:hypothetical protein